MLIISFRTYKISQFVTVGSLQILKSGPCRRQIGGTQGICLLSDGIRFKQMFSKVHFYLVHHSWVNCKLSIIHTRAEVNSLLRC